MNDLIQKLGGRMCGGNGIQMGLSTFDKYFSGKYEQEKAFQLHVWLFTKFAM